MQESSPNRIIKIRIQEKNILKEHYRPQEDRLELQMSELIILSKIK